MRKRLAALAAATLCACAPASPPEPSPEGPTEAIPDPMHIVVQEDGRILWQGKEITEEEFYARVDRSERETTGALILRVTEDGGYTLAGDPVTLDQLDARVAELAKQDPPPDVRIEPHPLAKYRYVREAVDVLQRPGLTQIGVIGGD